MKGVRITGIAVFLIAAFATAGLPMDGPSYGIHHSFSLPSAQCPGIAQAGALAGEERGYLHTGEFADSLVSVASGSSRFAPATVPPEWKAAAFLWREQVNARSGSPSAAAGEGLARNRSVSGRMEFDLGEGNCPSLLIYRAFLDYRAKTGRPDLKPVYPYQVRMAATGLAERFERVALRVRRIETSIREAERMGTRECSPSDLSIAWTELEVAVHQVVENGYDIGKTKALFANADRAVANLHVKRLLVMIPGRPNFVCN